MAEEEEAPGRSKIEFCKKRGCKSVWMCYRTDWCVGEQRKLSEIIEEEREQNDA